MPSRGAPVPPSAALFTDKPLASLGRGQGGTRLGMCLLCGGLSSVQHLQGLL